MAELDTQWCIEDAVEAHHILDELDAYLERDRKKAEVRRG